MTTNELLPNGLHGWTAETAAKEEAARPKQTKMAPGIERAGNGWYTVYGGEHGPCDRYGREAAEATLAAILADRG